MDNLFKFTKAASPRLQNEINTSVIFNYLREKETISRIKVSKDLKISPPAVSRAIAKLIKEGYVRETKKEKTKKGKWPILLRLNEKKGYVIGIDLGKEKLKMALANYNCEIVKEHQGFKISNDSNVEDKLKEEIGYFIKKVTQNKFIKNKIEAIYIGIPAVVDIDSGKIIRAPLYNNWKNLNFKKILEDEFNIPVYVENDVKLSSLGEKNYGKGKNFRDIVFLEISNGIGAGIINDNKLLRGVHGSAGEIGFSIIGTENLGFRVKEKGLLERFASVEGLKKEAIKAIKNGVKTKITGTVNGDLEKIEPNLIFEAAIGNDKLAKSLIEEMTNSLSVGIINLILILDPQIIFLGGDITKLSYVDELFLKSIIKKVKSSIPFRIPKIELSSLGENAGIIGACYMAVESIISESFPYKIEKKVSSQEL